MINKIKLRIYFFVFLSFLLMHNVLNVENSFAQFQPDLRLTNDPFPSSTSYNNARCVAVSGLIVHVVWHDARNTVNNYEIYYKRSTDGGLSWGADTRLTNTNNSSSELVSVSVSGSVVHLVWLDYRDGNAEIYYKRSTDDGVNWETDLRLTNNTFDSQSPSLSVSVQHLHTVWYDNRDGNYEIYYKRSTDGGVSWGADTRLTNNSGQSWYPSVSISGSSVHVVWYDGRDGNDEIYYKRSTDGGVNWGADTRLTNNAALSQRPSAVAVSGSAVHVVWTDDRNSNYEIYYKQDPVGNPTGIININSEIPDQFSLMQNYPNPFNPVTNIQFSIPKSGNVKLIVYDISGKEVRVLINGILTAGNYNAQLDASKLASGVYFYRLEVSQAGLSHGGFTGFKKLVLVK